MDLLSDAISYYEKEDGVLSLFIEYQPTKRKIIFNDEMMEHPVKNELRVKMRDVESVSCVSETIITSVLLLIHKVRCINRNKLKTEVIYISSGLLPVYVCTFL